MADPVMDFNERTGKHRIRLVDGDPVPSDGPEYEILTMWTESAGWPMEESPRRGPLNEEFPESTSGTPSALKTSLEERCEPLRIDRVLDEIICEAVVTPRPGVIVFSARYRRPGRPAERKKLEMGT